MNITTIDLDTRNTKKLNKILSKIRHFCKPYKIKYRESAIKGYHILIECEFAKICNACRLVFDDQIRYSYDVKRGDYKGTLWKLKMYRNLVFTVGEWREFD